MYFYCRLAFAGIFALALNAGIAQNLVGSTKKITRNDTLRSSITVPEPLIAVANGRQFNNDDTKWRRILRGLNQELYHSTIGSEAVESYISRAGMV